MSPTPRDTPRAGSFPRRVVLVGAGHAHLQVLQAWEGGAPGEMDLTVVVDREESLYSGMVPGLVAGDYRRAELTVPVAPLVRAAGGELVVSALTSVDPHGRRLFLDDGSVVTYDVASLNLGSVPAGWDQVPGAEEHAVPTRPLSRILDAVEAMEEEGRRGPAVVVGGGAAGAELAVALAARLEPDPEAGPSRGSGETPGARAAVTLVEAGPRLLPDRVPAVSARLTTELERSSVRVLTGQAVEAVEAGAVRLAGGERLESRLTLWATGAAPPPALAASPLPLDDRGFVRVRPTLQVAGHPDLFATGDCASVEGHALARAGVHAVRQGPVLRDNLERWIAGRPMRSYDPQKDFLTLLNLGDGRALGVKWGVSVVGRWVMWLKDRIDRRFVERFQR